MDSTADASRNTKRARLAPPAAADDDVDRISGLHDDVLLHILGLVADASDAVRTGVLSRRWRGLWTRVPRLRFASRSRFMSMADLERSVAMGDPERFVSLVNGVLAQRSQSDDCAIESLAISRDAGFHGRGNPTLGFRRRPWEREGMVLILGGFFDTDSVRKLFRASVDPVQGWIRYALQHGVKSLDVELSLPSARWEDSQKIPAVFLDDDDLSAAASSARLETMRLGLAGAGLRLSATVKFASLTVISLEKMHVPAAAGVGLLARLVSSAGCPRLQKLSLRKIRFDINALVDYEMRVEAQVLSELVIDRVHPLTSLELRTPSLRVLYIDTFSLKMLEISAPRLEEVALFFELTSESSTIWLYVDGDLACVRRIKLCQWARRPRDCLLGEPENDCGIRLLKNCSFVTCLEVTLEGIEECEDVEMDMIEIRVPNLPQVTSLTINVSNVFLNKRHDFGASVASLLKRFNNLRHFSLNLPFFADLEYNFLCDHPNHWINEFSMDHLQEAEFTGFTGIDCELWFIKAMLASANRLCRVAISFDPYYLLPQGKIDAFECLLLGGGMWTSHRDTYALTCIR